MQTLDQCLMEMVRSRLVSQEEARTYAANKDSFTSGLAAAGGATGGKR